MSNLRRLSLLLLFGVFMNACVANKTKSIENQAKQLTEEMAQTLFLDKEQKEKVLTINLLIMSLKDKLKEEDGDVDIKYSSEMRRVLSDRQYILFEEKYLKL